MPDHHRSDSRSEAVENPFEARSAGFCLERTYLQATSWLSFRILSSLAATKGEKTYLPSVVTAYLLRIFACGYDCLKKTDVLLGTIIQNYLENFLLIILTTNLKRDLHSFPGYEPFHSNMYDKDDNIKQFFFFSFQVSFFQL